MRVAAVRIQDFRAIRDLVVPLGETTVLIGENNSGKTSFLEALGIALGPAERGSVEDLHVDATGARASKFVIDVRLEPASGDDFEPDTTAVLGGAVQFDKTPAYASIRAVGRFDPGRGALTRERQFAKGWADQRAQAEKLAAVPGAHVNRTVLDLVPAFLLDARRDIVEQLRNRNTFWGRLAADLQLSQQLRDSVEAQLKQLGSDIVAGSPVLISVRKELEDVKDVLSHGTKAIEVAPVPHRLDDVVRSMDVLVSAPDSAAISVGQQGMGTRSLAALLIFRAFLRTRLNATSNSTPSALACFEEPEAHLHPQAQRAALGVLRDIQGQKIISTHSPYVVSSAEPLDIRLFRREAGVVAASWLDPPLPPNEIASLKRFVHRRNGEVLFSRAVVLFEGETEEASFPVFAHACLGSEADTCGVTLFAVGGTNYKPFVRFLDALKLPWFIFSDGDQAGQSAIGGLAKMLGRAVGANSPEIVMLPNNQDFEAYLIDGEKLERFVKKAVGQNELDHYAKTRGGQQYGGQKATQVRDYQSPGWEGRLAHDYVDDNKGVIGGPLASAMVAETGPDGKPIVPAKVRELFARVKSVLPGSGSP